VLTANARKTNMAKQRLDKALFALHKVQSRSQAESYIKLGKVTVNGKVEKSASFLVSNSDVLAMTAQEQYVSRAGLKLASVAQLFTVDFRDKTVLDVGSSTGGFTDYSLQHGAKKVIAVDVGTNQLHPSLRTDTRIELHEQTDIRNFTSQDSVDIVVIDVSFISLRDVLPSIAKLCNKHTQILAMVKPQFEAGKEQVSKGVIKNDAVRRAILKDFEMWAHAIFLIKNKADSQVSGTKGNVERFYVLELL
jgi:23S rRNA (cytidine1920-2'-O)/16S rRNA (cytidine1409-2'-O)-methyltransferase